MYIFVFVASNCNYRTFPNEKLVSLDTQNIPRHSIRTNFADIFASNFVLYTAHPSSSSYITTRMGAKHTQASKRPFQICDGAALSATRRRMSSCWGARYCDGFDYELEEELDGATETAQTQNHTHFRDTQTGTEKRC